MYCLGPVDWWCRCSTLEEMIDLAYSEHICPQPNDLHCNVYPELWAWHISWMLSNNIWKKYTGIRLCGSIPNPKKSFLIFFEEVSLRPLVPSTCIIDMVYTKSGKPGKSGNLHNWSGKIFEMDTKIKRCLFCIRVSRKFGKNFSLAPSGLKWYILLILIGFRHGACNV